MFRVLLLSLILASGSLAEEDCGVAEWDSEYDEPYTFKCPGNNIYIKAPCIELMC